MFLKRYSCVRFCNCLFWIYMATYKSEYTKIIIVESPFVFMDAYQCQRTLLQMRTNTSCLNDLSSAGEYYAKILQTRTKSSSLLEWFVECSWILCKDSANENKITKLAWMVCQVPLNFLQSYSKFFTHAMIFIIGC